MEKKILLTYAAILTEGVDRDVGIPHFPPPFHHFLPPYPHFPPASKLFPPLIQNF